MKGIFFKEGPLEYFVELDQENEKYFKYKDFELSLSLKLFYILGYVRVCTCHV